MNKEGNLMQLPVNLLILFIVVTFLIALIPGLVEVIDSSQGVGSLNCHGYVAYKDDGSIDYANSANDSRPTASSIGCMAVKLYIPYIVLGVLVAGVAYILYGRSVGGGGDQPQY